MEKGCIFCGIIHGNEPAFIVQEGRHAVAVLPKVMEVKGHTLVIPKRHFQDIFDISFDALGEIMALVKAVSIRLKDRFEADGINLFHASGESAQQSIAHFHVHVIPRFNNDNIDGWPNLPGCNLKHRDVLQALSSEPADS